MPPSTFSGSPCIEAIECDIDGEHTLYDVCHPVLNFENIIFHPLSSLKKFSHFYYLRENVTSTTPTNGHQSYSHFQKLVKTPPLISGRHPAQLGDSQGIINLVKAKPSRLSSYSHAEQPLCCLCFLRKLC